MAQVILGGVGGAIGGSIGRAVGSTLGAALDRGLVSALSPDRQRGPRLEALKLQSTAEGSPMACVLGRARVTGQMIWAARFLERRNRSSGGKGGPGTVDHAYSLSFAVALCEGPIDGIGRIWADGRLMDQAGVAMRVYRGTETQTPDPLIEAVEGGEEAPAYRGTAYVVFEDLPLGPFGDRPPQLSFEVFRRPAGDGLEERLEGVCLIPGAGEFVLATDVVLRREGLTRTAAENVHLGDGRTDLIASLDQLEAQLPNLKRVSLVVGWFGTDLRAGHCEVKPGVERRDKPTEPLTWSVAGLDRASAHRISDIDGTPAYGGTPSDDSVRQAIAALKARGWEVTLYPFVFMDIPPDNALPDPYGGPCQAAYPWRGRVMGQDGAGATAEIAAIFGSADDWGLRRLALHYAGLAAETGCDGLLIGSEMRGLTWTRDAEGRYPAVSQYRDLAAECRTVVGPGVTISYAADWSEYVAHRPAPVPGGPGAAGDVFFHLDPLWSHPAIDYVGIDWYPPLGDWRAEDGGVDATLFSGPHARDYLALQVAGGEGFDWYYASAEDRAAQTRTPIVDTAHGEHWVFRTKDLKSWWSHEHFDRPGGVRASEPTAWRPEGKPIRLIEFGCAAVDRGGNAPNLFEDPKSSESLLPPGSTGARDDRMQRRALEAVLDHYRSEANNPVSTVYGGPMLAAADAWCWDARPYPAFPALGKVWADAGAWRAGHWLNGRLGGGAGRFLTAILRRGGLTDDEFTVTEPEASLSGYVIDRPMRTRDAIAPLLDAFGMRAAERGGRVALIGDDPLALDLTLGRLALPVEGTSVSRNRGLEPPPDEARVRFIDEGADYQTGSVVARADTSTGGGGVDLDLPAVCGTGLAERVARRKLRGDDGHGVTITLGPLEALIVEPGDSVTVEGLDGDWAIAGLEIAESATARLRPRGEDRPGEDMPRWRSDPPEGPPGRAFVRVLDLPPLPPDEADDRPIAAVAVEPWRPMTVHVGETVETLSERGTIQTPSVVGRLTQPLDPGPVDRWDEINTVTVDLEGGGVSSVSASAVLAGANLAAVETSGGWEVLQFRSASLVGQGIWRLSGLLRGQQGSDPEMRRGAAAGSIVVLLDRSVARFRLGSAERGLTRRVRIAPIGAVPDGAGVSELTTVVTGRHARPWSPAGLTVERIGDEWTARWIPRARLGGDRWEPETGPTEPERFRVRLLDGEAERLVMETSDRAVVLTAGALAEAFPGGIGPLARLAVSQFGPDFGWGAEASVPLSA